MSFSKSPLSYADVRGVLDKALASERGIRIDCRDHGAAVFLRQRMNAARRMDRELSTKIYPKDDPKFGLSAYDSLRLRIPNVGAPDDSTVFVEKITEDSIQVKELEG